MDSESETKYGAATAGDSDHAITEWEKLPDLELESIYEAIRHTVTKYYDQHQRFIKLKLANKQVLFKVNGDEETALHIAARMGHYDVGRALIDAAELLISDSQSTNNINIHPKRLLDDFVWHPNRDKDTALHLALTNGNKNIAYRLIGASSPGNYGHDIRNRLGETPIYLAIKLGSYDIFREMPEYWRHGLPLDAPAGCGTVLHAAIIKFPNEKNYSREVGSYLIKACKKDMESSYSGFEAIFEMIDKKYDTAFSFSSRTSFHYG